MLALCLSLSLALSFVRFSLAGRLLSRCLLRFALLTGLARLTFLSALRLRLIFLLSLRLLIGLLLRLSRLPQTLGGFGNFFADAARNRRLRRLILFSGGLSFLRRLLQIVRGLLGGLSGFVRVPFLRRLLSGLHVLLTVRRLLSRLLRSLGRLRLIQRLLTELVLRLGQLLTEFSGGLVQFLLTLLLRGIRGSRLLAELFHLLRDALLFLREVFGLLCEFRIRARVVLQLIGQLLSSLRSLLSGL